MDKNKGSGCQEKLKANLHRRMLIRTEGIIEKNPTRKPKFFINLSKWANSTI
jgi:hypothetical protein